MTLSFPTGNADLGLFTTTVTINKHNGTTINATDKKPSLVQDVDGDIVGVKLGGKVGSATYYLTDGKGPIAEIDLAGTDPTKSTLNVTVKKISTGTVGVGQIYGTGVRLINLSKSPLIGAGINLTGPVQAIMLDSITGGADIIATGMLPLKKTRITVKNAIANGTDITLDQPLALLKAAAYGSDGTIAVPSIGTVNIRGNFKSNVTVIGGIGSVAIANFNVLGQVVGSTINVMGGNVRSVSVGTFVDSHLYVGYTGDSIASPGYTLDGVSTIGSFRTKAKTVGAFQNSSVIASIMNMVALSGINDDNGNANFGIFANSFKTVSIMLPFKMAYKNNVGGDLIDFSVKVIS